MLNKADCNSFSNTFQFYLKAIDQLFIICRHIVSCRFEFLKFRILEILNFQPSVGVQFEECFSIFIFILVQLPVGKEKVERAEAMLRNPRCLKTLVFNPNPHSSMVMVHHKEIMDTGCQVIQLTRFLIQCSPFMMIIC